MPFVPAPNTMEVELVFEQDAQIMENTLYYRLTTGTPTVTEMAALLDEINAFIRATLLPLLNNTLSLIRVVGTLLDAVDSLQVVSTTGLPAPGASTSPPLPNSVSLCMSIRTGFTGRSRRGRNYVAGFSEDAIAGNTVNGTMVTALLDVWNELISIGGDDGWEQVVVSRVSGGSPRTTALITPVTSVIVTDDQVDSQRRRLPGRGT